MGGLRVPPAGLLPARGLGGALRCQHGAVLAPRERLAVPGEAEKVVFVSSDATLTIQAACDWSGKVAARAPVKAYLRAMSAEIGREPEDVIIAVAELLGFVAMAAARAEAWR